MMEGTLEVATRRGLLHPVAALGRSWRRLRRRPRAMQVRTALIMVAIVVALIAWLMLAPSGTPGGGGTAGAEEIATQASSTQSSAAPTPVSKASTSTRG